MLTLSALILGTTMWTSPPGETDVVSFDAPAPAIPYKRGRGRAELLDPFAAPKVADARPVRKSAEIVDPFASSRRGRSTGTPVKRGGVKAPFKAAKPDAPPPAGKRSHQQDPPKSPFR